MPGIIRDPVHNHDEERNFGVVEMNGEFVLYFKTKENDLRYAPAGWKLEIGKIVNLEAGEDPYEWTNGTVINKKVENPTSKPWMDQGRMVRLLKDVIEMHQGYLFKDVTRYPQS